MMHDMISVNSNCLDEQRDDCVEARGVGAALVQLLDPGTSLPGTKILDSTAEELDE
jgi:hypothetical protein